jgi:hypothetical protein
VNCAEIPAFLSDDGERNTRCERLSTALGGAQCEQESVAPGVSPGIVEPDERLVRYLSTDYVEDSPDGGKVVKPNAFSHAGTSGMSVDRLRHRSKSRSAEVAPFYIGYVAATCADIRAIQADASRCFLVYDTASATNPAHADICQCLFAPKSQQAKYRRRLRDAFDRVPIPLEELSNSSTNQYSNRSMLKRVTDWLRSRWQGAKRRVIERLRASLTDFGDKRVRLRQGLS